MNTEVKKLPTPPYVAYKTLQNFLERFSQGVPGRIERSLMGTMSGAVQSQITTTLKYLGFISDNNVPQDEMKRYVVAPADQQAKIMRAVLTQKYPFIFGDDFDFSSATGSMVRERFEEHTTATGETIDRCISFLKDAAQVAGMPVSQFLSHKTKSASNGLRKKAAPAAQRRSSAPPDPQEAQAETERSGPTAPPIAAQSSLLLWGLFQRLPKPGTPWPKEERSKWTDALHNILSLEYPE